MTLPLRALAAVTAIFRDHQRTVEHKFDETVEVLARMLADRASVWMIHPSGAQMRSLASAGAGMTTPIGAHAARHRTNWEPTAGPVAEVLGARQPVEMGLVRADSSLASSDAPAAGQTTADDASATVMGAAAGAGSVEALQRLIDASIATTESPTAGGLPDLSAAGGGSVVAPAGRTHASGIVRGFGRFLPLWNDRRIIAVLGVERDGGRAGFTEDERVVLDAIAERLETALSTRELSDELLVAREQHLRTTNGLVVGEHLLRRLGTIAGDLLFRHRFGVGTEYVSAGVEAATGYLASEFRNDPGLARRIVHPDDYHIVLDALQSPEACDQPMLVRLVRRDGQITWQYVRLVPIMDDARRVVGVEGLSTDVTELKMAEEALTQLARSDPLTGVPNRTTFREFATRALARLGRHGGMVGALFLDLDGFKAVNDTLGHAAGDEVLIQVAAQLTRLVRREDVVGRLGGDEFAVLLTELSSAAEATLTAQRILVALDKPFTVAGHLTRISAGIGIAVTGSAAISPEELLHRADTALYQAKKTGRGRWQVFQPAVAGEAAPEPAMGGRETEAGPLSLALSEGSLRSSLAAGDFRVHFLPEVDARTGEIVALEALARWQHPQLGLLNASSFIDRADDVEVIHPLGDFVFREASRQVVEWRDRFGIAVRLRVNVSREQMARPGFSESTLRILASAGLAPSEVSLDVPEAILEDRNAQIDENLTALHRAGILLVIDDFGTGAATLRSLRRYPIERIKIDRSLVSGLDKPSGGAEREVVDLAVHVADSIGAEVIAEGVERLSQLERLRGLRCLYFQGSFASEPLSADAVTKLMEAERFTYLDTLLARGWRLGDF